MHRQVLASTPSTHPPTHPPTHPRAHAPTHPPTGVLGGFSPVNFQLVIDRPERVRRVMPPTTTSTNTQPLQMPSHTASCLRWPGVRPAVRAAGP